MICLSENIMYELVFGVPNFSFKHECKLISVLRQVLNYLIRLETPYSYKFSHFNIYGSRIKNSNNEILSFDLIQSILCIGCLFQCVHFLVHWRNSKTLVAQNFATLKKRYQFSGSHRTTHSTNTHKNRFMKNLLNNFIWTNYKNNWYCMAGK